MPRRLPIATGALAAYFALALVLALLPAIGVTQQSLVGAMAFSPADLVSGKLWLLPLSGVIVDGNTWSQLAMLTEVAAALVVLADARTFWRAAILGHVGSTFIAYAILGVLALTVPTAIGGLFQAPDYGVSCIWAGSVGALAVIAARRCSSRPAKMAVAAAVSAPLILVLTAGFVTPAGTVNLATLEHSLAFVLGLVAAGRRDGRAWPAPSALGRRARRHRATASMGQAILSERAVPPPRAAQQHRRPCSSEPVLL
jgi:hypothetical protein